MAACRSRCAELALLLAALLPRTAFAEPLADRPIVWHADDMRPIAEIPEARDPSVHWTYYEAGLARPAEYAFNLPRLVRRMGAPFGVEKDREAANVNRLGEVPNSSWFTNRIGIFPLPPSALELGPNISRGPSTDGPWRIVAAKSEGVTPGFTIEDSTGQRYLIKFGPRTAPVAPTAAGVISQRLLWAAGYWVPQDEVVHFRPEDLVLSEGVQVEDESGDDRAMVQADVDRIFEKVERMDDGSVRAVSSRFLDGRPIGPFDYLGRREDDPNDTVPHELHRELRGLNVFAEWLVHFDTKQQNSLDMVVEGPSGPYVRHYLIDFASTLGTGAQGPVDNWGWEVSVDPVAIAKRSLGLGIAVPDYRRVALDPEMPAAGWYESEVFEPNGFRPLLQNPAFQRMGVGDGYWAAKILSAFTDDHIRVAVEQGRYRDARTAEYMVRTLAERRDAICRYWFDRVPPLEFFVLRGDHLVWQDLGLRHGLYEGTPRYRVRVRGVDAEREGGKVAWVESNDRQTALELETRSDPFLEIELQVDRGDGFGPSVRCYVAVRTRRVVEVRREHD
jgi:hypothetical protein